ncbi:SMP-30/gluconolactonase/LRE family protein [Alteraurantiacibacter aquimixticola]|uniref:SMP-30/Gluconolactonase/LRE-like region domain-containing protein n=1 Tax=Alteraurantiacibacter aquimixticola TaxID=2489173 RepID=A0A4T3F373_9SPHN|nr:SMP-30/gluconolactonase/LRE family protein [Alteraurantiacibacter aquimixticola]TIX51706.1 hypothetical protein E5222_04445 [Alteraurantiacibacter aquimixticola]
MRQIALTSMMALGLLACSEAEAPEAFEPPVWTLEQSSLFPENGGLTHAEDGVVLPDGTLLVGDFEHGLLEIAPDGSTSPFGDFAAAGYESAPSPDRGGPNGISFEPDGRHVLVADIFTGAIYRVDSVTAEITLIYDHPYGVNSAVRDSSGTIWFTQSTKNPGGEGSEERMFEAVFTRMGDGALFRLSAEELANDDPVAEEVLSGLHFANGIALDEDRGALYVNELLANRVLGFSIDVAAGRLGEQRVIADVTTPDNVELDEDGRLWVTSPIANEVVLVDPESGESWKVFAPSADTSAEIAAEWRRLLDEGQSPQALLGPEMSGPMPGILTGVILSPGNGPVYVSGLGDALVMLPR